jgi:putative transposase
MRRILHSLLLVLARVTDRELARMVQYVKTENGILRARLPERIIVTPKERKRLLKFGKPLGAKIKELISIVSPRTFYRWVQESRKTKSKPAKSGRPGIETDIRELVLRMARDNGWGSTRILGELRKLGITRISRTTVVNILRENGLEPGPRRGEGTWDEFIKRHAATIWACDFFSKKIWTTKGLVDVFILFFINIQTRRILHFAATSHPTGIWLAQQARNLAMLIEQQPVRPRYLLHDLDTKFTAQFDDLLKNEGMEIKRVGSMAPNMNAHAERWVQSIKVECLDHFIVLGESHLNHLVSSYVGFYNTCRPHQGKDNLPLSGTPPPESPIVGKIQCATRLGGLLKHYYRQAA